MTRNCLAALAAALCLAGPAHAQKTAADIPVEEFFRRPQFSQMALSPDGSRLAALAPLKGRDNLVVLDVARRTRSVITAFEGLDVASFFWVNNERLCFAVADGRDVNGGANYRGSYCINQDGSAVREYTKFALRGLGLLALTHDGSPKAYVTMAGRTRDSLDAYLLDTETGRFELLTFDSPGRVVKWVLDRDHVPRVAVSIPERKDRQSRLMQQVWYRDGKDAKWEMLWEFPILNGTPMKTGWDPVAFDYDNRTLYVATNEGRDRMAIYKYDTTMRQKGDLVFEHGLIDVEGGLVFSRAQKKLLGIRYDAEKPSVKWFDPEMDRLQRQLDLTLKGTINVFALAPDNENLALVYAYSDTDPGMYHLLDRAKPSLEGLVRTRPWLDPALMAERRFVKYKARDGMEIPAWLTIPRGSTGKNLPLIVNVHGGPWVRGYSLISWGRWPEAQFFASRGYAVLEPEPRGSLGYGTKHFVSSFRQWGQAMQDDIDDGALYLVKEGIADRSRMCIHGGSYGGYAAAMGVARDPDLWKCGSPFVAVTDLFLFQEVPYSDISYLSDFFQTDFKLMVGDSDADRAMFEKYSPLRQAANVKAPVLLTMGAADRRVPQVHGDRFREALEKNGKSVEYVVYPGEGHGYNKDEHVFDFYRRLEKFYGENLK